MFETTRNKLKKKGDFPNFLVVNDHEILVRTWKQTKNFCYTVITF